MASTPSTRPTPSTRRQHDGVAVWAPDSLVDSRTGIFRGQGIGIAKAIVSLTLFHEGRIFITNQFKQHNLKKLEP